MKLGRIVVLASSLCKIHQISNSEVEALKDLNLKVRNSEFAVVRGPSGAEKTTLLNVVSCIDKPTSGKILVFRPYPAVKLARKSILKILHNSLKRLSETNLSLVHFLKAVAW